MLINLDLWILKKQGQKCFPLLNTLWYGVQSLNYYKNIFNNFLKACKRYIKGVL